MKQFTVGGRVRHKAHGVGSILSIEFGIATVAFDCSPIFRYHRYLSLGQLEPELLPSADPNHVMQSNAEYYEAITESRS